MAVIRVEKTKDYTVMSNSHLRNKELSIKAKGLLSTMLSLPDEWDYTVSGLAKLSNDGLQSIRSALIELEKAGYLIRTQTKNSGKFGKSEYIVYELPCIKKPLTENPISEKPMTEKPISENRTQLNTYISNTKELNTNISNTKDKPARHRYGEYNNVLLSDEEIGKLKAEIPNYQRYIESLSSYMMSTGKTYKSHLATIRNWARKDGVKPSKPETEEERIRREQNEQLLRVMGEI